MFKFLYSEIAESFNLYFFSVLLKYRGLCEIYTRSLAKEGNFHDMHTIFKYKQAICLLLYANINKLYVKQQQQQQK